MANKLAAIVNKISLLRGGLGHAQVVRGGVYVALHQGAAVIVLNKADPSTSNTDERANISNIKIIIPFFSHGHTLRESLFAEVSDCEVVRIR